MKWTGVIEILSVLSALTQRPLCCGMPGTGKGNGQMCDLVER